MLNVAIGNVLLSNTEHIEHFVYFQSWLYGFQLHENESFAMKLNFRRKLFEAHLQCVCRVPLMNLIKVKVLHKRKCNAYYSIQSTFENMHCITFWIQLSIVSVLWNSNWNQQIESQCFRSKIHLLIAMCWYDAAMGSCIQTSQHS